MRSNPRVLLLGLSVAVLAGFAWVKATEAYPGGVENYVTDAAPYCASCHSSVDQQQVRNLPAENAELRRDIEKVHYAAIRQGEGPYRELSAEQREAFLKEIQALDARASVRVELPTRVKPGEIVEARVKVSGGDGPVVGVMLLDSDLRYQARPIASSGWLVVDTPKVLGPDGKPQTTWTERRASGTPTNLSFVQVYGVSATTPAPATLTYSLRAPMAPGTYPVVAALLYGVEMGTTLGTVTDPRSAQKVPRGGFGGRSGRVMFAAPQLVTVR